MNLDWAPPSLLEYREFIATHIEVPLREEMLDVIDTLCSADAMESVWREIEARAIDPGYHRDFALAVLRSLRVSPAHAFTPAEFRRKRLQAAAAATKLREILAETGMSGQTVFPILGTKAMSGAVHYFLQGQGLTVPDDSRWKHELELLNAILMVGAPGVGTWETLLATLASRLSSDDPNHWPGHRAAVGNHPRAVNFVAGIGPFIEQTCGQPLLGTVAKLAKVFFPSVEFSKKSISQILDARRPA